MSYILHGQKVRKQLLWGAFRLAEAVGVTYGPHGRNCLLSRWAGVLSTRDGVTVAHEVVLDNAVENQGAALLRSACVKVNEEVGDGTTTTALLAAEILKRGQQMVAAGIDPGQLCLGIKDAADALDKALQDMSTPISTPEQITRVAMLASNGDTEVAEALSEATMAVGRDGTIVIEDGQSTDVRFEYQEGMELNRGAVSNVFLRNERERTMTGPLVAVINQELRSVRDIQDLLECASQWQPRELLIFSLGVSHDALAILSVNDSKGTVKNVPLQCPGFGHWKREHLQDIAALAGATLVTRELGMSPQEWNADWFGAFHHVRIRNKSIVITAYEDKQEGLQEYLDTLRLQVERSPSAFDQDKIRERMAALSGGLAVLKIGGVTEIAMKERRARVEDALASVRAALQGGVVPGGGAALLHAAHRVQWPQKGYPHRMGWEILGQAAARPLQILAENAGEKSGAVIEAMTREWADSGNPWIGWDASQGQIRNLAEEPLVMDPTKVVRAALRVAVSVATTILTVEVAITR